jgi:protein-disulfide isomerase
MARLRVPVTPHDHVRGPDDAAVTLFGYGDYECEHCVTAYAIVNAVQEHFGKDLRFVFRHFPLTEVHPQAEAAAEAVEFAAAHDRFWEMHDGLYRNRERLGEPLLFELARALALPESGLRKALDSGEYDSKIRADFRGGVRSGVNGTPTFFINGQRHDDSYAFDDLVATIEARLQSPSASATGRRGWRFWRT